MEVIRNEKGEIVGRAALVPEQVQGLVTVGGFRTSGLSGIFGLLIGISERASRDIGIPIIEKLDLDRWVQSQLKKISECIINEEWQYQISSYVRALQSNTNDLKIAKNMGKYVSFNEIIELVEKEKLEEYFLVQDVAIENYERENSCKIDLYNNVFYTNVGMPGIHQTYCRESFHSWSIVSCRKNSRFEDRTLEGLVLEAIAEAWHCSIEEVYKKSDFSSDNSEYSAGIGKVGDEEVIMHHVDIIKKPKM